MQSLPDLPDWLTPDVVPVPLCDMLLAGTVGREHLLRTASMAADAAQAAKGKNAVRGLPSLRSTLLAAAFEEDSLYGPTSQTLAPLLTTGAPIGTLPSDPDPAFASLIDALCRVFRIPENTAYYQRLLAAGEASRLDCYLENECRNRRHGLFWLHVALHRAVLVRDFERGEALIPLALPEEFSPLADKLRADIALLAGRPQQALALYEASLAKAPRPLGRFRAGLAAWQAGDVAVARAHFAAVLAAMPEHVSSALALYDLLTGRDTATAPIPDTVAIALYTYNKATDIDATLASLFASDIGRSRVTVLDNASTDATAEKLATWLERVGPDRLTVIRLPVNIGAPAARNWLAALPDLRQAAFVAYLDDDVDLPRDWLGRLFAARNAYPEAGVWGCRVADATNPAVAQGVGSMLVPAAAPPGQPQPQPWLSDVQAMSFDFGAFTHLRPCLSVMGCCHLFQGDRLRAAGGFDIRYSPSQYDDVDHDLRLVLAGRTPVYQGHLAVAHRRPAPVFAPPRPDQRAGGEANRQKLLAKLAENFPQLETLHRQQIRDDLAAKWRFLREAGLGM